MFYVSDSGRFVLSAQAECSLCTLTDTPAHARKSNYHAPVSRLWREMADVVSHPVPREIRSVGQTDVDVDRPQATDARQGKSRSASSLKRPVGTASGHSESASADATYVPTGLVRRIHLPPLGGMSRHWDHPLGEALNNIFDDKNTGASILNR